MGIIRRGNPKRVIDMDERFDQWIRERMNEPVEDRVRSEVRHALIKERIRARIDKRNKRRTRIGLIAVPVFLVAVIAVNFVDLGGDDFELVEVDTQMPGRLYKNEFSGRHVAVLGDETLDEIQEIQQQFAADEGEIVEVEGWEIGEGRFWLISRKYSINGEDKIYTEDSRDPETKPNKKFIGFLVGDGQVFLNQIESEGKKPTSSATVTLDGAKCLVQIWEFSHSEIGPVKYLKGKPIR